MRHPLLVTSLLALFVACASPATVGPTPSTPAPDATAPDARTPDDATAPDASTPDASTPDASTPDASTPDTSTPDTSTPDTSTPDATTPDATTPDVVPMGDNGPLLPPTDVGPLLPDAGALGEPAWVSLDVRVGTTCPPFTPCGGAVAGTWDVAGGCFDLPVPAELMRCPGARVTNATGRARGRVNFGPAIAARAAQWEVQAEVFVPGLCAAVVGGCDAIQETVRRVFSDAACVTEGAVRNCRCAVRQTGSLRDGDGYTTMNNQIVSTTAGRRWDYCVTGDRLRYRDVSTSGTREPGIIDLMRRSP